MPLIKKPSKKAFEHNMKAEMHAGKPKDQSLAIAYSVKRKSKKMAEGGTVSASDEKRPMPDQKANDAKDVSQNSGKKPAKDDSMTSQPERKQSMKGMKTTAIKHPSMVQSPVFKARLRDQEDDLMDSAKPNQGPQEQPPMADNEEDAKKSGPDIPALHMKKMANGGAVSMAAAEEDGVMHPEGLESDNDQMRPSEDEYMASHFAEGGVIQEEEIEHAASIAAAIMAKMKRAYAEGGEVDLMSNHEEEPNNEDQMSFEALKKENYNSSNLDVEQPEDSNTISPEHDPEDVDDKDIVKAIRHKMKIKSAITR